MVRLFLNGKHGASLVDFNYSVALRIIYGVSPDNSPSVESRHFVVQSNRPMKNIVTQDQGERLITNEALANHHGLCNPAGRWLHPVGKLDSPLATVTQCLAKRG